MMASVLVAILAAVTLRHPPMLTGVSQTSATLSFTLNEDALVRARVDGTEVPVSATRWPAGYTQLNRDVVRYEVTFTALRGGQHHTYEVTANGTQLFGPTPFDTAPGDPKQPVHAVVFGDSGVGSDAQREVAAWMQRQVVDLGERQGR